MKTSLKMLHVFLTLLLTPEIKKNLIIICIKPLCLFLFKGWSGLMYVHAKHLNKIYEVIFFLK